MSPRRVRILLACGVIGPPLFVLVFLVAGTFAPAGYSVLRHPVSSFAIGELGWVHVANFLVTGGLLLAYAVGLRSALRAFGGSFWVPVLVGLLAIGLTGCSSVSPSSSAGPGSPPWRSCCSVHEVRRRRNNVPLDRKIRARFASRSPCQVVPEHAGTNQRQGEPCLRGTRPPHQVVGSSWS